MSTSTATRSAITILYRAPWNLGLFALDVSPEDVDTYRDRLSRGAFCPRTLFAARPELWRLVRFPPPDAPGNVHEWCEVTS